MTKDVLNEATTEAERGSENTAKKRENNRSEKPQQSYRQYLPESEFQKRLKSFLQAVRKFRIPGPLSRLPLLAEVGVILGTLLALFVITILLMWLLMKPGSLMGVFDLEFTKEPALANSGMFKQTTAKDIESGKSVREFKLNEPITAKLEIENKSKVRVDGRYQVKNLDTGEVVRESIMPFEKVGDSKTSTRYVSIVSSTKTALTTGKYELTVSITPGDTILKRVFRVTD